MEKKQVICKLCGKVGHWKYQCYQNPKRGKALRKRYEQAYKTGKTSKHDKLLSSQSLDRKRLIMELDKYCSLIVRISASNKFGVLSCYTCGKRIPYKMSDNGHLKSRQFQGTRFDFDNMRPQCTQCNRVLKGNLQKYREHLTKEIGEERVNALDKKKSRKISTPELEELLKDLKLRYKKIVEEKKKILYN